MSVPSSVISELAAKATGALERAYTPRVERLSRRVGVHDLFVGIHDGLWRLLITVGYRLSGDEVRVAVGDAAADFHITSRTEYERATTLVGEREVVEALLSDVSRTDTFWDVGANVGLYTCLVSDRLAGGTRGGGRDGSGAEEGDGEGEETGAVIAFEPHPDNAERLRRNLRLNGLDATVDRRALSDTEGTAELYVAGEEAGAGAHSLRRRSTDASGRVEVTLTRGDTLVTDGEYGVPGVVKIDVEGAELDVLRGMETVLSSPACRTVYVEVHRDHGVSVDEVREALAAAGFTTDRIQDRGSTRFLRAAKGSPDPA